MIACDQASRFMSERLDNRLSPANAELLDAHLDGCAACQLRWLRMRRIQALFQKADAVAPPPQFTARVMSRLQARERERAADADDVERAYLGWSLAGVGVAALLLIAFVVSAQVAGVKESALLVAGAVTRGALAADTIVTALREVGGIIPLPAILGASLWIILGTLGIAYTVGSIVASYWPTSSALAEKPIRTREV